MDEYEFWFKDEDAKSAWQQAVSANCFEGYGFSVQMFCFRFALKCQERFTQEPNVDKGAQFDQVSREVDKWLDDWGLTGFQYGLAISTLFQVWKFGDELNKWHNTKYGQPEAEGTINPAIMHIQVPDDN